MVSLRDQTIKQLRDQVEVLTVMRDTAEQRAAALDGMLNVALAERDRLRELIQETRARLATGLEARQ